MLPNMLLALLRGPSQNVVRQVVVEFVRFVALGEGKRDSGRKVDLVGVYSLHLTPSTP